MFNFFSLDIFAQTILQTVNYNQDFVAINRAHDLLVHGTSMAKDIQECALQLLRNQLRYPVHWLDRKAWGILLFGASRKSLTLISD